VSLCRQALVAAPDRQHGNIQAVEDKSFVRLPRQWDTSACKYQQTSVAPQGCAAQPGSAVPVAGRETERTVPLSAACGSGGSPRLSRSEPAICHRQFRPAGRSAGGEKCQENFQEIFDVVFENVANDQPRLPGCYWQPNVEPAGRNILQFSITLPSSP
jgi:hypothetical protein